MGAFMTGKIRVEGDMGLALGLRDLLGYGERSVALQASSARV